MSKLRILSAAEWEDADALCWYAERSQRAAERFDEEFDRALDAIAADPKRFPRIDERHRFYLMNRYPYQVIYREEAGEIIVVAVAHEVVDIALPKASVDEFLQVASVSGFDTVPRPEVRWPKMRHRETGIDVDILPEGSRPGTVSRPAPTTIPHPQMMGAVRGILKYISLPALIELKLAAGRLRDEADVAELIRENRNLIDKLRTHLRSVHPQYVARFDELSAQLDEPANG